MKYLKDSFNKFKKDALSKAFYDFIKYLVISVIFVFALQYVPIFKEWLNVKFSISLWLIILASLILVIFSLVLSMNIFSKKLKEIQSQNRIDELTGLKNYKALEIDLATLENERNQKDEPISLILIDVDDFKKFNEENSFEIADKILSKLGNLLNKDSRITDETYRYFMRGDEFLIIAKQTSISNAQLASDRKRKLIQDSTFIVDGDNFRLTVCCGVTEFNKNEKGSDALERLSQAMQNAKKKPKKNNTEILI
ncbi:GGDEF domain-containing protein [Tenacibaculum sp. E3R01]|uniref:GGDEF domain-containing protein n=1 Tax=Tenacibaculum sp. E3R01 TaxID=2267227 RepID=UPI000DEB0435|nr:GGDEF domain-containing protein [Tenacibaculum sp. E3R01]RBW63423.1 GGDEF domain-containing protein [Tenacibaculum sp. E3R01]